MSNYFKDTPQWLLPLITRSWDYSILSTTNSNWALSKYLPSSTTSTSYWFSDEQLENISSEPFLEGLPKLVKKLVCWFKGSSIPCHFLLQEYLVSRISCRICSLNKFFSYNSGIPTIIFVIIPAKFLFSDFSVFPALWLIAQHPLFVG